MTDSYPNLETLQLSTIREIGVPHDDEACLSALCFPKLTSLTLNGFDLQNGAFLLSVNSYEGKLLYHFKIYLSQMNPPLIFIRLSKNAPNFTFYT